MGDYAQEPRRWWRGPGPPGRARSRRFSRSSGFLCICNALTSTLIMRLIISAWRAGNSAAKAPVQSDNQRQPMAIPDWGDPVELQGGLHVPA